MKTLIWNSHYFVYSIYSSANQKGEHRARSIQGRRQRGGQRCPASHLKSVPPISCVAHRLLHTSNTLIFKCGTPLRFWPLLVVFGPTCWYILATSLTVYKEMRWYRRGQSLTIPLGRNIGRTRDNTRLLLHPGMPLNFGDGEDWIGRVLWCCY